MEQRKFIVSRILAQLLPVYSVYLFMFRNHGLSMTDISLLMGIWCLPGFLLELPSSILADLGNRRNLMVAGLLMEASGFAAWALFPSFPGYAAGFLLWGTGESFISGTAEAWLYDSLKTEGREDTFDRMLGRSEFASSLAIAVTFMAGPPLSRLHETLPVWLSVGFLLVAALLMASLPERNLYRGDRTGIRMKDAMDTLRTGVRFCTRHAVARILLLLQITLLTLPEVLDEFDPLLAGAMGVPFLVVGLWGAIRYGLTAVGGIAAWRWKKLFAGKGKNGFTPILAAGGIGCLLLLLSAVFPVLPLLPAYGGFYLLLSSARVLHADVLQATVTEEGRATVQSLANQLVMPSAVGMFALIGVLGDQGVAGAQGDPMRAVRWLAIGMLVLIPGFVLLRGSRDNKAG